ncbi:MAG: FAD:protein FMN transferase [Acidimicrobiales bacterium]
MSEIEFRAMGSDAHVIVVGGPADGAERARARIDQLEQRWSRFIDDSEISILNRRAGEFVEVSDDTRLLVELAIEAWRISGGSFDPTVLGAVIRAGYDRSFEALGDAPKAGLSSLLLGCTDIDITAQGVRLPADTGFDPGGIGKGLGADIVAEDAMNGGADGVCINLGGDLRVRGCSPDGGGWTIDIEHPLVTEPIARVGVSEGAVATSTTLKRQWKVEGAPRHHLIDPATGLPSDSDLTLACVISAQAWAAEVLAKAVLLRGSAHPFDLLGGTGAQALVVDRDGRIDATDGFAAYLGDATLPTRLPS